MKVEGVAPARPLRLELRRLFRFPPIRRESRAELPELAYSRSPERHTPGNLLLPLINGDQAFPAMLEAIDRAESFVHLETYILADDEVGRLFASALCARARSGVAVRLLFDSFGSLRLPSEYVQRLTEAGVEVVEFRPMRKHWFERRGYRKRVAVAAQGDRGAE